MNISEFIDAQVEAQKEKIKQIKRNIDFVKSLQEIKFPKNKFKRKIFKLLAHYQKFQMFQEDKESSLLKKSIDMATEQKEIPIESQNLNGEQSNKQKNERQKLKLQGSFAKFKKFFKGEKTVQQLEKAYKSLTNEQKTWFKTFKNFTSLEKSQIPFEIN